MNSLQKSAIITHLQLAKRLYPFSFKDHQEGQLEQLVRQQHTLWHAPTGFGKTLLAICAMLPFVFDPTYPMKKILIVVRTKTQIYRILEDVHRINQHLKQVEQQQILQEFINQMQRKIRKEKSQSESQHPPVKQILAVPLIAKKDLCVHEDRNRVKEINCRAMKCPRKKQKKDIFPELVLTEARAELQKQLLTSSENIRNVITATAETQMECPHDIVTELLSKAEILITTHPWLHQGGQRKRLDTSIGNNLAMTGVILDEVHNFAPTWTAQFCLEDVDSILTEFRRYTQQFGISFTAGNYLGILTEAFQQSLCGYLPGMEKQNLEQTARLLQHDSNLLKTKLQSNHPLFTKINHILYFLKEQGDYWIKIPAKNQKYGNKSFIFRLIAFPTTIFSSLKTSAKSIYMSGTLTPIKIYQWYYNLEPHFSLLEAPVPARKELKLRLTTPAFVAKHQNRTLQFYEALAKLCLIYHQHNPQHTLVFTTGKKSSQHLHQALQTFDSTPAFKTGHIYKEGTSEENQLLLQKLPRLKHAMLVAQMGGSFHEGIEIKNPYTGQSKINLIIITGIPFTPPTILLEQLNIIYQARFQKKELTNWLLQQFPAIQTIRQACGRGIRSPSDACAIICTDKRLAKLRFFPDFIPIADLNMIKTQLDQFYINNF